MPRLADGVSDTDTEAEGVSDTEGLDDGVSDTDAEGLADGVSDAEGMDEGVSDTEAVGDDENDADAEVDGVSDTEGLADGVSNGVRAGTTATCTSVPSRRATCCVFTHWSTRQRLMVPVDAVGVVLGEPLVGLGTLSEFGAGRGQRQLVAGGVAREGRDLERTTRWTDEGGEGGAVDAEVGEERADEAAKRDAPLAGRRRQQHVGRIGERDEPLDEAGELGAVIFTTHEDLGLLGQVGGSSPSVSMTRAISRATVVIVPAARTGLVRSSGRLASFGSATPRHGSFWSGLVPYTSPSGRSK